MKRSKGFTLVELVIVIAVIAILAGVMIGVFSNVVKEAKKSAELQQMKNEELAQKADDVLKSVENADWLSWTEFEETLSTKLAEQTTNNQTFYTAAIQDALEQFIAKAAENNTGLTEDQVKYIVENAVAGKSTLTEDQVKSIVNAAVATSTSGLSTLTKAQVQSIVDIAQAKNLTAAQVKTVVDQCIDGKVPTDEDIAAIVRANTLTEAQITALLEATLPVTKKVTTADNLSNIAAALNSGSTIMFTGDWSAATAVVEFSANKTLYFRGSDVNTLTINAPAGTVGVYCNVTNLNVTAIATASAHIYGTVAALTVGQGHAVIEAGSAVAAIAVAPRNQAASVSLTVAPTVTVPTLTIIPTGTSVEVENAGTIGAVTIDRRDAAATAPLTIDNTTAAATIPATINVITPGVEGGDPVTTPTPSSTVAGVNGEGAYSINNTDKFSAGFTTGKTYKVTENITLDGVVTIPSGVNIVIDLNGYTVTAATGTTAFNNTNGSSVTFKGNGTVTGNGYAANYEGLIVTSNGSITTIKSGTYTINTTHDYTGVFFVGANTTVNTGANYGRLVIDGGTIAATGKQDGNTSAQTYKGPACVLWTTSQYHGTDAATDNNRTTLTINGGTFTSDVYTLRGAGLDQVYGTVTTINAGTFTSAYATCIYHAQTGDITLNGGSITGTSGIEIKGGNVNASTNFAINGGKIVANGTFSKAETTSSGTDGYVDAIAIIYSPAYAKPANVTIAGGTYTSANGKAIASYGYSKTAVDGATLAFASGEVVGAYPYVYTWNDAIDLETGTTPATVSAPAVNTIVNVTGGTFSTDVSVYCDAGYSYDSTTGMVTED